MGKYRRNDIERYLRGEMTSAEMHAFEKAALSDPFLSEAIEGFDQANKERFLVDLKSLHGTLRKRIRPKKRSKVISMWNWSIGIAAGLILLAVSSVYLISVINNQRQQKEESLALKEDPVQPPSPAVEESSTHVTESLNRKADVQKPLQLPKSQKSPAREKQSADSETPAQQMAITEAETATQQRVESEDVPYSKADDSETAKTVIQKNAGEKAPKKEAQPLRSLPPVTADETMLPPATSNLIQGIVKAEDNQPLPGVNVLVKGTNIGTVTDNNGNFRIASNPKQALVFNFIGMETVEVVPGDSAQVEVKMNPEVSALSEVVVKGHRTMGAPDSRIMIFAEPQGGRSAFQKYLKESMRYPEQALKKNIEGRVTAGFTVGIDGRLADFKILRGLGHGCDEELIRLIKEGPAWSPSKINGQPVAEQVKVSLKFSIPDR